jgi:hypothetical protein
MHVIIEIVVSILRQTFELSMYLNTNMMMAREMIKISRKRLGAIYQVQFIAQRLSKSSNTLLELLQND